MSIVRIVSALSFILLFGGDLFAQATTSTRQPTDLVANETITTVRLLDRPAKLSIEGVPLFAGLTVLQDRSGVSLVYSPSKLPRDHRVTCKCYGFTVGEALDQILSGTGMQYSVVEPHVLIEPEPLPLPQLSSNMRCAGAAVPRLAPNALATGKASLVLLRNLGLAEQTGTITGQVTDVGTGRPLSGAQVFVTGTNIGSITGADGRYQLTNVPAGQVSVQVQLLGYSTQEQSVTVATGETVAVDFALTEEAVRLGEVVASVDAVDVRRRELGTDIASIDVQEAVTQGAVMDMSELLQARGTGISVTRGSGLAGSSSRIRIRGPSSLTQDNNPLIIIDGVRASHNTTFGTSATAGGGTSRLNDLNPADIARMQVVKGPAATALYGSEASPGVIVITTKQGQLGVPEYRLGSRIGIIDNHWSYPDNYTNVTEFYGVTDLNDPRIAQFRAEQNSLTGDVFITHNPFENPATSPFRQGYVRELSASARGEGSACDTLPLLHARRSRVLWMSTPTTVVTSPATSISRPPTT